MSKVLKSFIASGSFLPGKITKSIVKGETRKPYELLEGTLFYLDISGFTSMSENLAKIGKEGAEKLAGIINDYFDIFNDIIARYDGDIYRFGGDAIFGFVLEDEKNSSTYKAATAVFKISEYLKEHNRIKLGKETFNIKMHAGLTYGKFYFQDLKTDYFLGGQLTYQLMKIVDTAKAGEIMVNTAFKNKAKKIKYERVTNNIYKITDISQIKKIQESNKVDFASFPKNKISKYLKEFKHYLPDWLNTRIELNPYFNPKDGEHRKMAILFVHFKGIDVDENSEFASRVLSNFYENVEKIAKTYDAYLNKIDIYKDSARMLLILGFPYTHEDIYIRASFIANEIIRFTKILRLKITIGINGGFAFASPIGDDYRREYTVMGDVVNLAARFASSAPENSIIVGESIYKRAKELFEFKSLGTKSYKGKSKKIKIYQLMSKKKVDRETLSHWLSESEKFVGREKEMAKIDELIEQVIKKKTQIIGISGVAGLGKSRMTQEIVKKLQKKDFIIYKGSCVSYGSSLAYHPWINILNGIFDIRINDSIEIKKEKIKKKIGKVNKNMISWEPIIEEIMGLPFEHTDLTRALDAKLKKQRFFDIMLDLLKHIARTKNIGIILDDIHWADSATMELLNYVARNILNSKILFITVFRPMESVEFMGKKNFTHFALKPLNKRNTLRLVKELLNIKHFPDELKEMIFQKSQGNPFYTEEIVKSIIEMGFVKEDEHGKWYFEGELDKIKLPDSVEGVILTRVDRLEIKERDILQVASILGVEFDIELLFGIYKHKKEVKEVLKNLSKLDILKKEENENTTIYFFKHIITQEVVYGTISFEKRRELHRKVASYLERKHKNNLEDVLNLLSYHYYKGEDFEKALIYSVQAGDKAKEVYANEEAIEFYTRAIESYKKLENEEE